MLDNPVVAYCVLLRWWEKNVCSTPIIPQVPLHILRLILVKAVDQSTWTLCSALGLNTFLPTVNWKTLGLEVVMH